MSVHGFQTDQTMHKKPKFPQNLINNASRLQNKSHNNKITKAISLRGREQLTTNFFNEANIGGGYSVVAPGCLVAYNNLKLCFNMVVNIIIK